MAVRLNKRKVAILTIGNPSGDKPKLVPKYFRFEEKILSSAIKNRSILDQQSQKL